jgi:hypothetical protein
VTSVTLNWDYEARTVDMSMFGYIAQTFTNFQHEPPKRPQHATHAYAAPTYVTPAQVPPPTDDFAPLPPAGLTRLQKTTGTLASNQTQGTEATTQAVTHLLNYCATHPDAVVRFHVSDMCLHIHSDASYLSELKAKSRSSGYTFLSNLPKEPTAIPYPNATPHPENSAIRVHSAIMKFFLSSATEAETDAVLFN